MEPFSTRQAYYRLYHFKGNIGEKKKKPEGGSGVHVGIPEHMDALLIRSFVRSHQPGYRVAHYLRRGVTSSSDWSTQKNSDRFIV